MPLVIPLLVESCAIIVIASSRKYGGQFMPCHRASEHTSK
jgi:hypothetical protein